MVFKGKKMSLDNRRNAVYSLFLDISRDTGSLGSLEFRNKHRNLESPGSINKLKGPLTN